MCEHLVVFSLAIHEQVTNDDLYICISKGFAQRVMLMHLSSLVVWYTNSAQ